MKKQKVDRRARRAFSPEFKAGDEARARLGLSSRTELIGRALHAFLGDAGEEHVATLLAGAEPADNE